MSVAIPLIFKPTNIPPIANKETPATVTAKTSITLFAKTGNCMPNAVLLMPKAIDKIIGFLINCGNDLTKAVKK